MYSPTYVLLLLLSVSRIWAFNLNKPKFRGSAFSSGPSQTLAEEHSSPTKAMPMASAKPPRPREPCNGYVELCSRRYSNITVVGAHNSMFRGKSLAANQERNVWEQLDDGIRFLQGQMHWPVDNDAGTEPHFCHTSCDLLDAGPISRWLGRVNQWIERHPREVITVLLGNGNYSSPSAYAPYIEASGIVQHAFTRPLAQQAEPKNLRLRDWPTLNEMINRDQRVVLMLDYQADETAYPWLLAQFNHMWETPFDPIREWVSGGDGGDRVVTPASCMPHRPAALSAHDARTRLYMLNHNVNLETVKAQTGPPLIIPATSVADQTNGVAGNGSLGAAAAQCQQDWRRPPTVLNVDYYNRGQPSGSVFQVAARMNNVMYKGPGMAVEIATEAGEAAGDGTMAEANRAPLADSASMRQCATTLTKLAAMALWAWLWI